MHAPDTTATIPLVIRRRRGTRHITLSYHPLKHQAHLTLPWHVSKHEGLAFAAQRRAWLHAQIAEHGAVCALEPGASIPLLGRTVTLLHDAAARGVVREEGATLVVAGSPEFFTRRLTDWLKALAAREMRTRAEAAAATLGVSLKGVRVREMHSRWGSCGEDGAIALSWRLIFAPTEVMDYVICHEVAHRVEMNHSPRFWRVVASLCPHHAQARTWLKRHGQRLYAYR